ncbi:MAG: DegV family EDD domain-containing protein [Gemmatimonadales bacterium]|nr:MAG: DegV family EDD domain-containing protein [Gemmatimonadales bacterium]
MTTMRIAYMNGPRLRRAILAGCDHVEAQRRELNRINVFPVPDGDTGTNLALTVRAIRDHLRRAPRSDLAAVAREAAEASIMGARGNSGMMLSHFLLGFADAVEGESRLDTGGFTSAMEAGVTGLYEAMENPVEGTILTVMRETVERALALDEPDFLPYLNTILDEAKASLQRTPDLLPSLREAGVVDAGGKGFVHLLEGVTVLVTTGKVGLPEADTDGRSGEGTGAAASADGGGRGDVLTAAAHRAGTESDSEYRYCTEGLVRGNDLPPARTVRETLREKGDSMVVVRSGTLLKVHIHTDEPGEVFDYLRTLGRLDSHKAEDMKVQQAVLARHGADEAARRPVALVTESANDLPEAVIRAHGIHVVPLLLLEGDDVLRDGVDITAEEFHARLDEGGELPTTSQPSPADFLTAFGRAGEEGDEVLYLGLSSGLSGTYASAEAAAGRMKELDDPRPLHRIDTKGASILQGLLVLRAAELAELGVPPTAILKEIRRLRSHSGMLFTVDTLERLLASGRVGRGKAFIARLLDVKPILELSAEGKVEPVGKARGRDRVLPATLDILAQRVPPGTRGVRFGIVHVGCPEVIPGVRAELEARYEPDEILEGPATAVLATHLGPGAWGVGWSVDDGSGAAELFPG